MLTACSDMDVTAVGMGVCLCLGLGVDVTNVCCYSRCALNIVQGKVADVRVHLQDKHWSMWCSFHDF